MATQNTAEFEIDIHSCLPKVKRRPPKVLYHYTTRKGLLGILSERAIYASNIRYLNDAQEFLAALKVFNEVHKKFLATTNGQERDLIKSLAEWVKVLEHQGEAYVVCASTKGDQLSQWRAYGGSAGGYSIGFRTKHLRDLANEQDFGLFPCIYEEREQQRLVEQALDNALQAYRKNTKHKTSDPSVAGIATGILSFLFCAPLIKDASFAEESEWRLVRGLKLDTAQEYRSGKSMLVPYMKFCLGTGSDPLPIEEIIVGPGPHQKLDAEAVSRLLGKQNAIANSVRWSRVPYRNW